MLLVVTYSSTTADSICPQLDMIRRLSVGEKGRIRSADWADRLRVWPVGRGEVSALRDGDAHAHSALSDDGAFRVLADAESGRTVALTVAGGGLPIATDAVL